MFTVKATYTTNGHCVTDLIECVSVRVTQDTATWILIHGGPHDGLTLYVGKGDAGFASHMHSVIVENCHGKTTEIFRDHRPLDQWRDEISACKSESIAA